jgi:hypothetical protein
MMPAMEKLVWLLAMWASGTAVACGGPKPAETPEAAYLGFYRAVTDQRADWAVAIGYLAPEVKETFRRIGQRMLQAAGRQGDGLPFFLTSLDLREVPPLQDIEVISREEGKVTLRVSAGTCQEREPCPTSEVVVRREGDRWLVAPVIPEAIRRGADANLFVGGGA